MVWNLTRFINFGDMNLLGVWKHISMNSFVYFRHCFVTLSLSQKKYKVKKTNYNEILIFFRKFLNSQKKLKFSKIDIHHINMKILLICDQNDITMLNPITYCTLWISSVSSNNGNHVSWTLNPFDIWETQYELNQYSWVDFCKKR